MRACAIYDITPHVGPPTISGFPTPSVMAFDKAFKASLLSTVLPGTVHKPDLSAMVRAMHHQLLWDIRSRRDNRCKVNERTAEKQTRSEHGGHTIRYDVQDRHCRKSTSNLSSNADGCSIIASSFATINSAGPLQFKGIQNRNLHTNVALCGFAEWSRLLRPHCGLNRSFCSMGKCADVLVATGASTSKNISTCRQLVARADMSSPLPVRSAQMNS